MLTLKGDIDWVFKEVERATENPYPLVEMRHHPLDSRLFNGGMILLFAAMGILVLGNLCAVHGFQALGEQVAMVSAIALVIALLVLIISMVWNSRPVDTKKQLNRRLITVAAREERMHRATRPSPP